MTRISTVFIVCALFALTCYTPAVAVAAQQQVRPGTRAILLAQEPRDRSDPYSRVV